MSAEPSALLGRAVWVPVQVAGYSLPAVLTVELLDAILPGVPQIMDAAGRAVASGLVLSPERSVATFGMALTATVLFSGALLVVLAVVAIPVGLARGYGLLRIAAMWLHWFTLPIRLWHRLLSGFFGWMWPAISIAFGGVVGVSFGLALAMHEPWGGAVAVGIGILTVALCNFSIVHWGNQYGSGILSIGSGWGFVFLVLPLMLLVFVVGMVMFVVALVPFLPLIAWAPWAVWGLDDVVAIGPFTTWMLLLYPALIALYYLPACLSRSVLRTGDTTWGYGKVPIGPWTPLQLPSDQHP